MVRDSGITEFPSSIFNTLTSVSFLSLSLINNRIETLNPFTHTKSPVINQHGTILHNIHLTVSTNQIYRLISNHSIGYAIKPQAASRSIMGSFQEWWKEIKENALFKVFGKE